MCGLVGIAGQLEFKDENIMKRLLIFDYFRGTDSTGFASFKTATKTGDIVKIASSPIDLFDMKKFHTLLNGTSSSVFLGHNRSATMGKVNNLNSHPFKVGKIIGAHNGTLTKESWKALDDLTGVDTDVDSLAIFTAIDMVGIEETVKHLVGAWALTWINEEENTINFLRNKERPFWTAWASNLKKIYWGSEFKIIDASISLPSQHETKTTLYKDNKNYCYFATEEDMLYTFDLAQMRAYVGETPMDGKVKTLVGRPTPPKPPVTNSYGTNYNYGTNPFQKNWYDYVDEEDEESKADVFGRKSSKKPEETVEIIKESMLPFASYLTSTEFNRMVQQGGCSWCEAPVNIKEKGLVVYKEDETILCKTCAGNHTDYTKIHVDITQ